MSYTVYIEEVMSRALPGSVFYLTLNSTFSRDKNENNFAIASEEDPLECPLTFFLEHKER